MLLLVTLTIAFTPSIETFQVDLTALSRTFLSHLLVLLASLFQHAFALSSCGASSVPVSVGAVCARCHHRRASQAPLAPRRRQQRRLALLATARMADRRHTALPAAQQRQAVRQPLDAQLRLQALHRTARHIQAALPALQPAADDTGAPRPADLPDVAKRDGTADHRQDLPRLCQRGLPPHAAHVRRQPHSRSGRAEARLSDAS